MPRLIHGDDDRVLACPECDEAGDVYKRTHKYKTFDPACICHKCGAEFEESEIVDRESQHDPEKAWKAAAEKNQHGMWTSLIGRWSNGAAEEGDA